MMQLTKYKLSDVAKVEISGVDKKSHEGETPVKLCNFTDVYNNWAITKDQEPNFMRASANDNEIRRFTLRKGQVAFTKDSETRYDIGIPTYIADDFDNVLLGYHCALITPNEDIALGAYINAFMHTSFIQKYFANNAGGSGQRYTLSVETMENMPLLLPSMENQIRIAKLLSNLDRKIALSEAMNVNLEALARQLFDYWFIQFDFPDENGNPYKSSGGTMVYDSVLKREIPIGWKHSTLNDMCIMYQPQTLGLNDLVEDGQYLVYGANGIIGKYHSYNHEQSEIAMACRGSSCGTLNRTMPHSWITGNAMVVKLKDEGVHNEFLFHALSYVNVHGAITGSGQPQLTRENLQKLNILQPAQDIMLLFSKSVEKVVALQIQTKQEIASLIQQRNELLPILMNGQISIG